MSPQKLANPQWVQGQILEPEHFRAGEEATAALACLVGELRGLPFHGVARLTVNKALLAEGSLTITSLTVVMADGTLLDVPGNAGVSPLSLKEIKASKALVYLHLLPEREPMPRTDLYDGEPAVLKRARFKLWLSLEDKLDGKLDSKVVGARLVFPLIEIVCDKLGAPPFRISPSYSPPLISAFGHPFLDERVAALGGVLSRLRKSFAQQFSDPLFRGERLSSARFCDAAAARIEIMIAESRSSYPIMPHPHTLFDAMRTLWIDLMALDQKTILDPPLYQHDKPAACFDDLIDRLKRLSSGEPVRSVNLRFSRASEGDPFVAREFSDELCAATDVYFVVERTADQVPLGALKLASPPRLDRVRQQSLPGVNPQWVRSPPFQHGFGPMVDFYKLDTDAGEWKIAVGERALAYYPSPALAKVQTALYWRSEVS